MRLAVPLEPSATSPLTRANPLAKLLAALLLLVALFVSLDAVTALVVLAGLALVVPFAGLSVGVLWSRTWLLVLAAGMVGVVNVLFAAEQLGPTVASFGALSIGAETLLNGAGLALRLLAIGLSGILATATSQPTALADALIQHLQVSPRFAIGTLAALRLVPLLAAEWQVIGLARRARGVDAGRSPIAAVRLWAGKVGGLLVRAVRRGSRLALAMEARGFGARSCRTSARPSPFRPSDWAWVGAAAALGAAAVGLSLALGTWRPLLG
jgi:energy-coupling factor transport system permease protein